MSCRLPVKSSCAVTFRHTMPYPVQFSTCRSVCPVFNAADQTLNEGVLSNPQELVDALRAQFQPQEMTEKVEDAGLMASEGPSAENL